MNVFFQNMGLAEDPTDLEINPDYVGLGSSIWDNDDIVDGEDTELDDTGDDNDDGSLLGFKTSTNVP